MKSGEIFCISSVLDVSFESRPFLRGNGTRIVIVVTVSPVG